ncbi:MAG TPA: hypothetical protein VGH16_13140 [Candidatus Binatia bacterium]
MNANTPAEAPVAGKAAAALCKTISDLPTWPPRMTWSYGHAVAVAFADTIIDVEWVMPSDGLIGLRLVKADAQEYGIELSIPAAAAKGVFEAIRPGMKLSVLGGLELAEASPADMQKTAAGNSDGV